jgi:hypothetical protein
MVCWLWIQEGLLQAAPITPSFIAMTWGTHFYINCLCIFYYRSVSGKRIF